MPRDGWLQLGGAIPLSAVADSGGAAGGKVGGAWASAASVVLRSLSVAPWGSGLFPAGELQKPDS